MRIKPQEALRHVCLGAATGRPAQSLPILGLPELLVTVP